MLSTPCGVLSVCLTRSSSAAAGSRVQEHLKEVALGKKVDSVLKEHESPNVVVIHSNKVLAAIVQCMYCVLS